jgi:hypothetical protein
MTHTQCQTPKTYTLCVCAQQVPRAGLHTRTVRLPLGSPPAPLLCRCSSPLPLYWYFLPPLQPPHHALRTGFSKVKSNRDLPTMANEEWTKRFLRLACYSPKDTREPRGPEHMAKMKAARGPYSDPRDTYIARTIRYAFESSGGKSLSTGQLVKEVYGWQLRVERKPLRSWHYQNVRRALRVGRPRRLRLRFVLPAHDRCSNSSELPQC